MPLFTINQGKAEELGEKPFKLEKDIQQVFEDNLDTFMGLRLVKSEFSVKNRRIDTLAFDPDACAFIIIEYKRDKSNSVVDQGIAYLNLMLENKAEFIVEYNESLKANMTRSEIDWSQTRVAFVASSFTENQKQATNFKDLAIELWEVKRFENSTLLVNVVRKSASAPSIKQLAPQSDSLAQVSKEIKEYTEKDHYERSSEEMVELYQRFKEAILNLADNIDIKPKKLEIGFTHNGKIFSDICLLKGSLKIWINLKRGQLDDPRKIVVDVSSTGHWGNGDYQIQVSDDKHLEYIMSLVKQSIKG
ncbi:DUF5655 domain-containing protein [Parapedobacter sp. DT-150]|uniref:DUF5655 domain-containing protein n=1 Tax=Parapedobacter sp. DT-150 TaxID=3396162 RepID=UPI003F1DB43B